MSEADSEFATRMHRLAPQETNRADEDFVFADHKKKETIYVKHYILTTVMTRITEGN